MAKGNTDLYGSDPQGEAMEVASAGLANNCVLDINGGAADKMAAEQTVPDSAVPSGEEDTENRGS